MSDDRRISRETDGYNENCLCKLLSIHTLPFQYLFSGPHGKTAVLLIFQFGQLSFLPFFCRPVSSVCEHEPLSVWSLFKMFPLGNIAIPALSLSNLKHFPPTNPSAALARLWYFSFPSPVRARRGKKPNIQPRLQLAALFFSQRERLTSLAVFYFIFLLATCFSSNHHSQIHFTFSYDTDFLDRDRLLHFPSSTKCFRLPP